MLTDRELPPDEWDKLAGTELAEWRPFLHPEHVQVAVVENDAGEIIACWAAVRFIHAEGAWIRDDYRGQPGPALRLWRRFRAMVERQGVSQVVTGAKDEQIARLLNRARALPMPQEFRLCLR